MSVIHKGNSLRPQVDRRGAGPESRAHWQRRELSRKVTTAVQVPDVEVIVRRIVLSLLLLGAAILPATAQSIPQLPFESVPDPLTLPDDVHFGEIAGVAVNSKGHVFVFSRGNSTGPSYMATAAQLLEFDANGKFIREIGKNLYALVVRARRAHRQGRQHLGRRQGLGHDPEDESAGPGRLGLRPQRRSLALHVPPDYASTLSGCSTAPASPVTTPANNNPRNPVPVHRDNVFNQPTDVAWDSQGNSYFTDGYVNSRVGKANARGEWIASWGSLGTGPGQFDTPHGIAVSPKDEVYVADRGNRRIQVFDTAGKFLRQFTIDVPVDTKGKVVFGAERRMPKRDRRRLARPTRCA